MASLPFGHFKPSQPSSQLNEKEIVEDLGPDDSISVVSPPSTSSTTTFSGNGNSSQHPPTSRFIMTPTSSSVAESTTPNRKSNNIPYITRNSAPGPGSTYIIAHNPSGGESKALTVIKGRLCLTTPFELLANPPVIDAVQAKAFAGTCNWHWHCEELDGWLGFQNAATGLWLGASRQVLNKPNTELVMVVLDATCVGSGTPRGSGVNKQFCVRKAADEEGYVLLKRVDLETVYLSPVEGGFVQEDICIAAIDPRTAAGRGGKLLWEFVKVDHEVVPERV
ncbi:hypothetical protein B0T20DRAFT_389668 [Sordaria brevicollis]|uniref:Uncharacterized protein n=1 Tax=Sordaria brevicollis TaxID=83679 RepID=A0AAE0UF17_SORBR|nr:hypothetical protein B0T20DRAFT_389668 [Sordaria brevicollis]